MKKKQLSPLVQGIIYEIINQRKKRKKRYIVNGGKMPQAEFEKHTL